MAVIVSACLLGANCRYDGGTKYHPELLSKLEGECLIPVCPEQLGGLGTPRPSAEIVEGSGPDVLEGRSRVVNHEGQDVTENYLRGAREVTSLARLLDVKCACLKELSPACGVKYIKRGDRRVPGMGVAAAALVGQGVKLVGV